MDETRKHAGYKVIAALMIVATFMGTYAYSRFDDSEKHLTERLEHFAELGKTATPMECAEATLAWFPTCSAMLSLCQDSVGRMMRTCLAGQDRSTLCAEVEPIRRKTSFGYADCAVRGFERTGRKACADVYRAIDKHCEDKSKE